MITMSNDENVILIGYEWKTTQKKVEDLLYCLEMR